MTNDKTTNQKFALISDQIHNINTITIDRSGEEATHYECNHEVKICVVMATS